MAQDKAHEVGDLNLLSPSRISTAQKCGLAFKYQYVSRIPSGELTAALTMGNVVHDGLQDWYGTDEEPKDHVKQDLGSLFKAQWQKLLPPEVGVQLAVVIGADEACTDVENLLVQLHGYKGPRQTKKFQESAQWGIFNEELAKLLKVCDDCESIRWPKDENALQAYKKSLIMAENMERRWKQLPRPLAVERPFLLEFEGYQMRGRIDQFRADPLPTGEALIELLDIKTGRNLMEQMEAFIQAWVYWKAIQTMDDLPNPEFVTFYMARHDKPQRGKLTPEHDKLALRILNDVGRSIITASYEPHYGFWCGRCDFRSLCQSEINMWPAGTDGVVLPAP